MNTLLSTTQNVASVIGALETYQETATLNGSPWNLSGGTATLTLVPPTGAPIVLTATIPGSPVGFATVNWTVIGPAGQWKRAWTFTDASGNTQPSRTILFTVIALGG